MDDVFLLPRTTSALRGDDPGDGAHRDASGRLRDGGDLYELREHSYGLNAGRWDYMFSAIKTFRSAAGEFLLPDRNAVTMTVPFLRAYTELLVSTCHRRGAFAMGGMAAFIPSRRNAEINERALAKVREDKEREARDGFDGTWVAHPDLVPVARQVFDQVLGDAPNQIGRRRDG